MSERAAVNLPIEDLKDWELNPRKTMRDLGSLECMIREAGAVLEPLHVWFNEGQYLILQGHRRAAVIRKIGEEIGVREVPCIVEDCADEAEALTRLMQLQTGSAAFDPMEESYGLRSMVDLGMTDQEISMQLGRPLGWVQLRLALDELPIEGKDALVRGQIELPTVQLVLSLEDAEERRLAVQAVLHPEFETEPLTGVSARRMVENFLRIQESRRQWSAELPKLKRKYPRTKGFSVIEKLEEAEVYCHETGQPKSPYGFADETIDARLLNDARKVLTWGELGGQYGAATYVVCAPLHRDGHVLVVNRQVVEDADAVGAAPVLRGKAKKKEEDEEKSERGSRSGEGETGSEARDGSAEEGDVSAEGGPWPGSVARMPWIVMDNEVSRVGDPELSSAWDDLQKAMGWK